MEEGNVGLKDGNVGVESISVGVKDVNVGVNDEYNSDDSEDGSYQYDNALEVAFEDDYGGYDEMEEDELVNLVGYESDGKVKGKEKWEKIKKNLN